MTSRSARSVDDDARFPRLRAHGDPQVGAAPGGNPRNARADDAAWRGVRRISSRRPMPAAPAGTCRRAQRSLPTTRRAHPMSRICCRRSPRCSTAAASARSRRSCASSTSRCNGRAETGKALIARLNDVLVAAQRAHRVDRPAPSPRSPTVRAARRAARLLVRGLTALQPGIADLHADTARVHGAARLGCRRSARPRRRCSTPCRAHCSPTSTISHRPSTPSSRCAAGSDRRWRACSVRAAARPRGSG